MNTSKKKIAIKSLSVGALLGAAVMFSVAAATSGASRTAWEYKIVLGKVFATEGEVSLEKALNRTVAEGWDFVSASPMADQWGFAVLKRERK